MKKIFQTIFACMFLILLLVFINLETSSLVFNTFKTILVVLTAIFIPGYLFVLLFLDKTGDSEVLVFSITTSVCFVILTGILIHFTGASINVYNILNKYNGRLSRFLNDYMADNRCPSENFLHQKEKLFNSTIDIIYHKIFEEKVPTKMKISVLEGLLVGVAHNLVHLKSLVF